MDHLRLMHASDVRSWRAARSFEIRHGRFLFSVAQGDGFTGILELGSSEHARFAVMGTAESVTEQTKLYRVTIRYFAFDTEWPFEMTILPRREHTPTCYLAGNIVL